MDAQTLFRRAWSIPPSQKWTALAIVVAFAVILTLAFTLTRDTRVALFASPLEPEQVAEIETRLAAWNVAYAPDVANVRVDRAHRADILLRLAIAGLPHPHLSTTEELFAHAGALTPEAVLDAQTRDGLAGELALGLRGLDGVADARVIVAPARIGMYADENSHDASASVRLTLAPGARLAAATVTGIKAFVAGGVPGLEPTRVTVLDDRGLALDGDTGSGDDGRDAAGVQNALQSALDVAFGTGATIVRVHRETSGVRSDIHDVRRTPLGGAIGSTSVDERYLSDRKRYSRTQGATDHGSDTRDEHRLALPGTTTRVSVAIFVDAARTLDLSAIRALAEATAGIDLARGDMLRVEAVRFAPMSVTPRADRLASAIGSFIGVLPQIVVALAIVIAIARGARPGLRMLAKIVETAQVRTTARDVAGIPPLRLRGALANEPPHIAAAIISALPAATAAAVLELYPAEERAAIVRRLSHERSPLVPPAEELLRVHV